MSETLEQDLSGVSETMLLTLYLRALESQRPDALIKDKTAEALVKKISDNGLYDFSRIKPIHMNDANKLVIILRNREFDRYARDFLACYPDAVVVHIGCGLDSRFERVAEHNSQVEWYNLDFPDVIELRRKYLDDEGGRYHLLGCSVLEEAWLDAVSVHGLGNHPLGKRPFLFLAEGVFMYLEGAQVKSLVLKLRDRFPGVELVFDSYSPLHVWRHNLQTSTSKVYLRVRWGIWYGEEIEGWGNASPTGAGIRLLDEWGFFDCPEPRLAPIRWMRGIEAAARTLRIYHFQLGKAAR
jgi:methyltransferase (TIGR00027 family)